MGCHRPGRLLLSTTEPELQEGDVGRLTVGVHAVGLDVGTLHQSDMHASADHPVGVGGRAQQIGLHGGTESLGQSPTADVEHAVQHRIGA